MAISSVVAAFDHKKENGVAPPLISALIAPLAWPQSVLVEIKSTIWGPVEVSEFTKICWTTAHPIASVAVTL